MEVGGRTIGFEFECVTPFELESIASDVEVVEAVLILVVVDAFLPTGVIEFNGVKIVSSAEFEDVQEDGVRAPCSMVTDWPYLIFVQELCYYSRIITDL